jgi:H+/Cl- antiporter ClcA
MRLAALLLVTLLAALADGAHGLAGARTLARRTSVRPRALARAGPMADSVQPPLPKVARSDGLTANDLFSSRSRLLGSCVAVGSLTGFTIALFKKSIAVCATLLYGADFTHGWVGTSQRLGWWAALLPALGGLVVAGLRAASPGGKFGPTLSGHVGEVERGRPLDVGAFAARSAAAVVTLGTGNSLGPEGPSVEIGCGISRLVGAVASANGGWPGAAHLRRRQRQLLAAGAAAGVAAGFNAPLAGVFFALEVVAGSVSAASVAEEGGAEASPALARRGSAGSPTLLDSIRDSAELDVKSRTAISGIVLSALVSAVVVQELLGGGHTLAHATWPARLRLIELPLYIGLGAFAGATALVFKRLEAAVRGAYEAGALRPVPGWLRPATGGLLTGLVGVVFPQVLFFGYNTLDAILASGAAAGTSAAGAKSAILLPLLKGSLGGAQGAPLLPWPGVGLLCAKLLTTASSVACGLVGGIFAPSLLLGAALGVVYEQLIAASAASLAAVWPAAAMLPAIANVPTFAMVGSAALLASVFRAPLTSALLIVELTRGYELVLPLLCAAGTGPLVFDAIERRLAARRRDKAA